MVGGLTIHRIVGVDELDEQICSPAARIVSIIGSADEPPHLLARIDRPVLTLRFDDIIAAEAGCTLPSREHVQALLEFDAAAQPEEPLLVHCAAGVSRSTAAMAVLLAARHPALTDEIFAAIRTIRPRAWPNSLVVTLGDEMLGRRGTLLAALKRHYEHQVRDPVLGRLFRMASRTAEIPEGWAIVDERGLS
jgi:predicted protein tyrosine phosphatase